MIHEFVEHERIKEPLCLEFFKTIIAFQREDKHQDFTGISYKELMKRMHIGRDRLQRLLNCVHRNWVYFKLERGYMVEVHNITSGVDWSRRFFYDGQPFYHIKINLYKNKEL